MLCSNGSMQVIYNKQSAAQYFEKSARLEIWLVASVHSKLQTNGF